MGVAGEDKRERNAMEREQKDRRDMVAVCSISLLSTPSTPINWVGKENDYTLFPI